MVRQHPDGTVVSVRVAPGASAAALSGYHGEAVKIRVCSPPIDGRANAEVVSVLAGALSLRERDIEILSGHSARSKRLLVALPVAEVARRLEALIGPIPGS
ncbi:MAG: DUF167 domain-containing protein [Actinobacteria bacterium]|nr:DUF167 domain-containing protein [Actinomycetota bacterium]